VHYRTADYHHHHTPSSHTIITHHHHHESLLDFPPPPLYVALCNSITIITITITIITITIITITIIITTTVSVTVSVTVTVTVTITITITTITTITLASPSQQFDTRVPWKDMASVLPAYRHASISSSSVGGGGGGGGGDAAAAAAAAAVAAAKKEGEARYWVDTIREKVKQTDRLMGDRMGWGCGRERLWYKCGIITALSWCMGTLHYCKMVLRYGMVLKAWYGLVLPYGMSSVWFGVA
jgi:hypothetical protein